MIYLHSHTHAHIHPHIHTYIPTHMFSLSLPPRSASPRYVLFCWDNIFASYQAGALGYREVAYSNLIQIVKAKSRDGYVEGKRKEGCINLY